MPISACCVEFPVPSYGGTGITTDTFKAARKNGKADVTHRKDKAEEQAIALLQRVVAMSEADRDALSGSAVKHVKLAIAIMRKRRRQEASGARPG